MKKDLTPVTVGAHQQKVKEQQKHDVEYWRQVLSTYEGRTVLWRVLELCGAFRDYFSTDAAGMAHFLGQRHVGLQLIDLIHTHHAQAYMLMQQEEAQRQVAVTQAATTTKDTEGASYE